MVERIDPDFAVDERTTLVQFLDWYRAATELKSVGLSDGQAATPACEPSMLTVTGIIRHMAEVERHWFRRCYRGEDAPPIFYTEERPDGDLEVLPTTSLADSITIWRGEIAIADEVLAGVTDLASLAATPRHGNLPSMRWILVHMIEEYARHCGHLDLIRERLDGQVGD